MKWNRRNFLKITGGVMAALGVGVGVKALSGRVFFDDWRALPGMTMILTVEVDSPETKQVEFMARTAEGTRRVGMLHGAHTLEVEIPYVETAAESYELVAVVHDWHLGSISSEPVEVLTQSYRFGL